MYEGHCCKAHYYVDVVRELRRATIAARIAENTRIDNSFQAMLDAESEQKRKLRGG